MINISLAIFIWYMIHIQHSIIIYCTAFSIISIILFFSFYGNDMPVLYTQAMQLHTVCMEYYVASYPGQAPSPFSAQGGAWVQGYGILHEIKMNEGSTYCYSWPGKK